MITQTRNQIDSQHLQELLDSAGTSFMGGRATRGKCQYETPARMAEQISKRVDLYGGVPSSLYDPQCFKGALLRGGGFGTYRFGIEIDKALAGVQDGVTRLIGDCVDISKKLIAMKPDLCFDACICNPPFSLKWDGGVDSTEWTWKHVTAVAARGAFIGNDSTLRRLGIHKDACVHHYDVMPFPGVSGLSVGVAYWKRNATPSRPGDILDLWIAMQDVIDEERRGIPPHNVWMQGREIRTYLSTFEKTTRKLTPSDIATLLRIDRKRPETLAIQKTVRKLLRELVTAKFYSISPESEKAIQDAVRESDMIATPLMPPTDFAMVAWAGEEDELECHTARYGFVRGQKYKVESGTYPYVMEFTRKKQHLDKYGDSYTAVHDCVLSGIDAEIKVMNGKLHRFRQNPTTADPNSHFDHELFEIFRKPAVMTIKERDPSEFARVSDILDQVQALGDFKFLPGQAEYIARMAVKDFGYVSAVTGCGKTLMCISMLALKPYQRALIIAPQGCIKGDEHSVSQWRDELERFAPQLRVYELFSREDYYELLRQHGGELPLGVFISYYEAMFTNGAIEVAPPNMGMPEYLALFGKKCPPELRYKDWQDKENPVGSEKRGYRSILKPSLSTLMGDPFDFIALDEGHILRNTDSVMGSTAVRMRATYRYILSATPIPNSIQDLFGLSGWLCVPGWHDGQNSNAVWPYLRGPRNKGEFIRDFQCSERDLTQEKMNIAADPKKKAKCVKNSPVIASPAKLIKLTSPFIGYIDKPTCNPSYRRPEIIDVRVPMAEDQAAAYDYYLDLKNIVVSKPTKDRRVKCALQISMLRSVCADPSAMGCNPLTPKVLATMKLIGECLKRGEQVLVIGSRVSLNDTVARLLSECGISFSRVDSTVSAAQHSRQAKLFKEGVTPVQLMGIKCAQGHSYDACRNQIIHSIEWSNGALEQAFGRTDRINSKYVPRVYVILHKDTVEDYMFDTVMTKDDSAKIVLKGQRIPRGFKPMDLGEIIAEAKEFIDKPVLSTAECAAEWEITKAALCY